MGGTGIFYIEWSSQVSPRRWCYWWGGRSNLSSSLCSTCHRPHLFCPGLPWVNTININNWSPHVLLLLKVYSVVHIEARRICLAQIPDKVPIFSSAVKILQGLAPARLTLNAQFATHALAFHFRGPAHAISSASFGSQLKHHHLWAAFRSAPSRMNLPCLCIPRTLFR